MIIDQPNTLDEMIERTKIAEHIVWRRRNGAESWKNPFRAMDYLKIDKAKALEIIQSLCRLDRFKRDKNRSNPENEDVWIFRKPIIKDDKESVLYIKISSRASGDLYVHSFHVNQGRNKKKD